MLFRSMVPISAKTGENIDKLLDMVLLVADMEELKADTDVPAEGLVIEAHMEKGRGSVVNLLVEQGQLKPSHFLVAGTSYGKVRTLANFGGRIDDILDDFALDKHLGGAIIDIKFSAHILLALAVIAAPGSSNRLFDYV